MSDPYYRIVLSSKERRLLMSANLYSIESLLIGKAYRSRTLEGIIQDAEKSDVWYDNAEAYRVRVRPTNSFSDTYRIVAVKVGE
jgi:hypothetical protein